MLPGEAFIRFGEALAEQAPALAGTDASQAASGDPHYEERTRLFARALVRELVRIGGDVGPDFRRAFAGVLARRMSLADIETGSAFYASPAGARFARGVFSAAMRPANLRALAVLSAWEDRQFARMGERVAQRIAAATAHLSSSGEEGDGVGRATPRPSPVAVPDEGEPPPAPVIEGPPADPARLAAAQRVVTRMWPVGWERELFVFEPLVDTLLPMRIREFGVPLPAEARVNPESTLRELFDAGDPHFDERVSIAARIISDEFAGVMARSHPQRIRLIADAYAREFTAGELESAATFLESPPGRNLIGASIQILQDRTFVRESVLLIPRVVAQLPAVVYEMTAATAHLPPPPVPEMPQLEIPFEPSEGKRRRRPRG
jgi:hypothetical protein